MPIEPRIRVKKSNTQVFIEINGEEHPLTPILAKEVGDALFKAGCDVKARLENNKK